VFDLSEAAVGRPRGGPRLAHTIALRTRRELASIVVIFGSASLIGLGLLARAPADAPAERAAIETAITLLSVLTVTLLALRVTQTRQLQDRMLLGASIVLAATDFAFSSIPSLVGSRAIESATGASLASGMLVALAFAAVAFAPSTGAGPARRRMVVWVGLAAIGTIALAALLEILTGGHLGRPAAQSAPAAANPVAVWLNVLSAVILVVAAVAFLTRAGRHQRQGALLAGASFLLAGARLQYLTIPFASANAVIPASGLQLLACGLLLVVALRRHATTRREVAKAAVNAERERIARDLHDGLAQDLAFIAAYGQRLHGDLGADHPMIVAAARALAASRGALVDLSASSAPSTATALKQVAGELATRFGARVHVRVEQDGVPVDEPGLDGSRREEIVRITREAIVNAIRHGGAHHVDISLERRGAELRLRVSDDGCGISEQGLHKRHGFGLPTMRARAEALGGRLTARASAHGGTELAVVVSEAAATAADRAGSVSDREGRGRSGLRLARLWERVRPIAPAHGSRPRKLRVPRGRQISVSRQRHVRVH